MKKSARKRAERRVRELLKAGDLLSRFEVPDADALDEFIRGWMRANERRDVVVVAMESGSRVRGILCTRRYSRAIWAVARLSGEANGGAEGLHGDETPGRVEVFLQGPDGFVEKHEVT